MLDYLALPAASLHAIPGWLACVFYRRESRAADPRRLVTPDNYCRQLVKKLYAGAEIP